MGSKKNAFYTTWEIAGRGLPSPRFSDLMVDWLRSKVGRRTIDVVLSMKSQCYSVRIDGILVGWVDDKKCTWELASGEPLVKGEVRRRRDVIPAADPMLFDKIWERMLMIDKDIIPSSGYSITAYKE